MALLGGNGTQPDVSQAKTANHDAGEPEYVTGWAPSAHSACASVPEGEHAPEQ